MQMMETNTKQVQQTLRKVITEEHLRSAKNERRQKQTHPKPNGNSPNRIPNPMSTIKHPSKHGWKWQQQQPLGVEKVIENPGKHCGLHHNNTKPLPAHCLQMETLDLKRRLAQKTNDLQSTVFADANAERHT